MNVMKTSEILKKARAHLVKYGWRQGDYGVEGGPCCAVGALSGGAPYNSEAHRLLMQAIKYENDSLSTWNDAPGRTKRQVLAAFTKAIRLAEKEEKTR